ncbi:glycosyltransferase family 4 protein [Geomonas edaphica]|uniref:glycosyltransferase family 4 protein n=1 Tax=Geomonas edaphica TaxID=2570226 RepID=UPI0013A5E25B|nr:glycosyltransferase family 4 protein [Geomonas edaphica]
MVIAHLRHLAESGHEVVLRVNALETVFPMSPSFVLERPLFPGKWGTLLSSLFEKQNADLVLATIVPTALLLWVRNRGRVVYFAQDDNETACNRLLKPLIRLLSFLVLRVCSLPTVAVSHVLASTFKKRFGTNCWVVENGISTDVFYPAPSSELITAKEGRKSVLVLSRKDPRKGFDLALKAIKQLPSYLREQVEIWTVDEKLDIPNIKHRNFGVVDEARMRVLFSSADVFLYPSWSEGFGLMVLEAFACGCPVVTTEAVGFVRNTNALVTRVGDVASLAEKLAVALTDPQTTSSLTQAGFELAQRYEITGASEQFEGIIKDILSCRTKAKRLTG